MRLAICQINNTVGDLPGNTNLIARFAEQAAGAGADLAVFPELALTGYPPRDLVEKPSFLDRAAQALHDLAAATRHLPLALITGYVGRAPEGSPRHAANSAAVIERGEILFTQTKMLLPTYDVFDESRNFQPGGQADRCSSFAASGSRSPSARMPGMTSSSGSARSTNAIRSSTWRAQGAERPDRHQRLALSHE